MTYIKKNFFIIFLAIYFVVGAFYSLNTGLSHDEFHEQRNWEYNVALVKHLLFQNELNSFYENYPDKFYGIGFQLISQPVQLFLASIILKFQNIDSYGAHLISKHLVVFISFFTSGIFVYLIISKIVENKFFRVSSTFLYLLYPYLLGHGLFNPKDIPFLCFWIICTYVSINIFTNLSKEISIKYSQVLLISCLTAFLLSIRITGVLIFIQYLITLIIFLNLEKINFLNFIKSTYKKIIFFITLTIFLTYLFYPVFWKSPFLVFDAINYMSNHFNNVCTLTLGKCMFSKNLDPTYLPIWFLVKLPLIILVGLIFLPLSEKKILVSKTNKIVFGTLLISTLILPLILILKKSHLYDELRQVIFLIPSIFILGIISLYFFSRKIFNFFIFFTLIIFIIENIKIYPYQYSWFNTPSRIFNLSKNFELDYWGLSGRDLAKQIDKLNENVSPKPCVLISPTWLVKPFLNQELYTCFGLFSDIDSGFERPFFAVQNVRNLKRGKFYKCKSVYESKFNLFFSSEDLITGRLLKCN